MRPIILGAKWPLGVSSTAGSGARAEPVAGCTARADCDAEPPTTSCTAAARLQECDS